MVTQLSELDNYEIFKADIDLKPGTLGFLKVQVRDYYYTRKNEVFNSFTSQEIETHFLFNEYYQELINYSKEKYVYPVSLLYNLIGNHLYTVEEIVKLISEFSLKKFNNKYKKFLNGKKNNRTNKRKFLVIKTTKKITKNELLSFLTDRVDKSTNTYESEYAYHLCEASALSFEYNSLHTEMVGYALYKLFNIVEFDYCHRVVLNIFDEISKNELGVTKNYYSWKVYKSEYPTESKNIKDLMNCYVNSKFKNNEKVTTEEIFILLPNNLTPFGMQHLEEVIKELDILINKGDKKNSFYKVLSNNAKNPNLPSIKQYTKDYDNDVTKIFRNGDAPTARKNAEEYNFKYKHIFISSSSNKSYTLNPNANVFFMEDKIVDTYSIILRDAENIIRKKCGLVNVGEGWVSETELFYKIKAKYGTKYEVIHGAKPEFLGRQHLDIFIKELSIAIEYQGLQHFEPVDFFGGEKAFLKNQERDKRKLKLCKENGVDLIYAKEGYEIEDIFKIINKKI